MERIGDYSFVRNPKNELGRGAYSIVYKATCDKTEDTMAIKIINIFNMTPRSLEILNDEVTIMELIKENPHKNIIRCYDIIKTSKELFIVLEYCDSGHLGDILKKPIKEKYVQFYFSQLVCGLKYLDSHSIIHRDIKPSNILLTAGGKVLKIADFGFAKKVTDNSLNETMCGSPLYMAPEIIGNNTYNNQTDLWSIGMILYEMLYAYHPFRNCKTFYELKLAIMNVNIEIPPSNTKNKDVSHNCLELLRQLLVKNANDRICWSEFFSHPWILKQKAPVRRVASSGAIPIQATVEKDNQSSSVSVGSVNNEVQTLACRSSPIIKVSPNSDINIIDNLYCNSNYKIEYPVKNTSGKKKRISYTNSPDDCIFEMELEDTKKVISVKNIIEISTVLEDGNDYDLIDEIK